MHRFALLAVLVACKSAPAPAPVPALPADPQPGGATPAPDPAPVATYNRISRSDFNRFAVRLNLPIYWIADRDNDRAVDPDEVATLLFYPTKTAALDSVYEKIVAATKAAGDAQTDDGKRRELVAQDLDQGRPTLVATTVSAGERAFVATMLDVGKEVDALYERMNGASALLAQLPKDAESHSLFRRNRGPKCAGPATEISPSADSPWRTSR